MAVACVAGEPIDPDSIILSNVGDELPADAGAEPSESSDVVEMDQASEPENDSTRGQSGSETGDAGSGADVENGAEPEPADAAPPDAAGPLITDASP